MIHVYPFVLCVVLVLLCLQHTKQPTQSNAYANYAMTMLALHDYVMLGSITLKPYLCALPHCAHSPSL